MAGYLILVALCVFGAHAIPRPVAQNSPIHTRVGGNVPAETAPHACMVLVHRTDLEGTNTAALGGGSIISSRHVLTAAHLVQGSVIRYQIGFIVGTARRLVEATFRLIHEEFDNTDFKNDIALIFLQGTATFPLANAITISIEPAAPTTGTALITAGFGFTAANSTGASSSPFASNQAVAAVCEFDNFELTDTHFCATDESGATWVCPGDNGSGAYSEGASIAENRLVGIVSRVLTGCAESQLTGYTIVGQYVAWITNVTGIPVPTFIANYNKKHNL
ncbi:Trypsin Blo t 3 [Pseudolycoriella hygida]|uniref:Trypsin Blo t 3 n=1 Tax=Pseudolycoriella hygida TaxID=35572 RepID=A0A9Q0NE96_9DIPT|nr:Trypsin Blo t 3 [Pseudolycoriella hygida]